MVAQTCPREECEAEIKDSKRVASVGDEYRENHVGRIAHVCENYHITTKDVPEEIQ